MTQKHFVLVHGSSHGAWCWYKLKPLLESGGHKVTALDLSASGVNPKQLRDLRTLHDYTLPLMELMAALPNGEKVILVGHSFGGINIALAMENFPHKISVAVFLTAFMPDSVHPPSYILDQFNKCTPAETWLDTQFLSCGTPEDPLTSVVFGPQFMSKKLYQMCSPEDIALGGLLIRPSSYFTEDLPKVKKFTNEGYGSVKRVYIICSEDQAITLDFQRWLIENIGVVQAKEIKDADHMAMLSKPQQLCEYLLEIARDE
ncbi:salicylic acid-binding protein 2-like [Ipomoea triloba]|uniref:salicylic acid-binding protein 2-like n=1 Tax=Ipomoea triloba TaxID=35885 RepID=UPI00125D65B8|nr:salicylic acid-binding protein 2-like [Ipomoea triloba]